MKTKFIWTCLILTLVITGCGKTDGTLSERDRIINQMDPTHHQNYDNDEYHDQLGFVRYKKEDLDDDELNHSVSMDRTKLANMITQIILRNDGFNEVATLVTGQEVLIAYERNETIDESVASDIAKKTAESIMPRFFDVYVTDRETFINDIHSLHNSRITDNYQDTVEKIIEEMKNSP